jgi:hypothetical protein
MIYGRKTSTATMKTKGPVKKATQTADVNQQRPQRQRPKPLKYVEKASYDHRETKIIKTLKKNIQKSTQKAFILKQGPRNPSTRPA